MMQPMRDLYQQVIMDHNRNPRNFGPLQGDHQSTEGHNPLCGDQITLHFHTENDLIAKISWEGVGCAISKSSASLMSEAVKGKSIKDALALYQEFHNLVTREGEANLEHLGKLKVFAGVGEFPARVKCAKLAWRTLEAGLTGAGNEVSTE